MAVLSRSALLCLDIGVPFNASRDWDERSLMRPIGLRLRARWPKIAAIANRDLTIALEGNRAGASLRG